MVLKLEIVCGTYHCSDKEHKQCRFLEFNESTKFNCIPYCKLFFENQLIKSIKLEYDQDGRVLRCGECYKTEFKNNEK
jgi:hypothetical protein